MIDNPHSRQPVLSLGPPPARARLTCLLVHGRGSSAQNIMKLAAEFRVDDVAYLAPEAAGSTWYPYSFLAPLDQNEPALGSALNTIGRLLHEVIDGGVPAERVVLMGFSQGACLSLEFAARNPRRYAAVVGLSGGLIGPPGTPRDYTGSLAGTPVFLGCSDVDAHIPLERVHESAAVLRGMGASVDEQIYPQMGHVVNDDEIQAVRRLLMPSA